jgi:hypothetical protein
MEIDKILDILDDPNLEVTDFETEVNRQQGMAVVDVPGGFRRVQLNCGAYFEYEVHGNQFVELNAWRCDNPRQP